MIEQIKQAIRGFDAGILQLEKSAFVPGPPPQGPAGGPPPGDPAAAGGPPPVDPNAMPPQGPPPPGDPAAGGAPPPPPGDPAAGGAPGGPMPPELEQVLSRLGGGMQEVAQTVEQQQATVEQLGTRQLELENKLQELMNDLKGPAPFEGSAKSPGDVEAAAGLPEGEGAPA